MTIRRKPVFAVAGLACENSTFTPSRTHAPAFHPKRGSEIAEHYAFLQPGTPLAHAADWRGALIGHALPGGAVTHEAFEQLSGEIVRRLEAIIADTLEKKLDGLWFDIHGAMTVEGFDDVELELLTRIRRVVGPHTMVSASMDLHGNVSRELIHQLDLITCYRMAPHEDALETKERACRNLAGLFARSLHPARPFKAWIPVPMLLPGEQTSTRDEPAKHIYEQVPGIEYVLGVIDAGIWVGYAWADEPRNRAVIAVTGYDRNAVANGAEELARSFWDARAEFKFVAPTGSYKKCLDVAVKSKARPYFISDSGDNPTAGGSGDVTWGLVQLLERSEFKSATGLKVIYASVPGPKAVAKAVEAGVGSTVTVTAGAEVDKIHAGPITMTGRVHAIKHGDKHAETEVVLQVGNVFAILTKLRKPYHLEKDFLELDLRPREADVVIVKIGYLEPELYNMAADWMLALTPGGVDQDLKRLGHHRIHRPMWPFDTDEDFAVQPDLRARIIPMSNEPLTGPYE